MASIVLTAAALTVLIARIVPDAVAHRRQIHAAGDHVTMCAAQSHRRDDSELQTLRRIAGCAGADHQIRTEAGDEAATLLVLALAAAGSWHLMRP
ncbi:hypothetical protein F1D05_29650 [Kribbella qitaiheensis]|uniref:Uncharacterized protein n=1 Tax=Kribbella qitaiheensis TaxID=1544730 RepID=A0A7G6X505_9ACTN|nr:hypothetical protein [Kribbella qitaiheensis]QNE21320.1 hypothetical protein F1D05_29650 [Kribbella qitaiheensis]